MAAAGADVQRPLWASTSVKNPAFPDTMYVDQLIGPHTVNTMPRPTIAAFLDHGTVARTIDKDLSGAYKTMEDLAAAGIDMTPSPRNSKRKASPRSPRATTRYSQASPRNDRNWRVRLPASMSRAFALRAIRKQKGMVRMPDVILRQVPLPDEVSAAAPPVIDTAEYERRCDETLTRARTPWVAVYGDRSTAPTSSF